MPIRRLSHFYDHLICTILSASPIWHFLILMLNISLRNFDLVVIIIFHVVEHRRLRRFSSTVIFCSLRTVLPDNIEFVTCSAFCIVLDGVLFLFVGCEPELSSVVCNMTLLSISTSLICRSVFVCACFGVRCLKIHHLPDGEICFHACAYRCNRRACFNQMATHPAFFCLDWML